VFLTDPNTRLSRHGAQIAGPARFLILMQGESDDCQTVKGMVRNVALRQCGHWMMGRVEIDKYKLSLSGSYGADGLLRTVPDDIYRRCGLELPQHLYDLWRKGVGWNAAGSEATEIRKWAISTRNRGALKAAPKAWDIAHSGSPCLDGMNDDELQALYDDGWKRPKSVGREWYGSVAEAEKVATTVRQCAKWMLVARASRRAGNVEHATWVESCLLEREYDLLPEFAKW
jgi:hypothetical protein